LSLGNLNRAINSSMCDEILAVGSLSMVAFSFQTCRHRHAK
jgi:hypothetical protein